MPKSQRRNSTGNKQRQHPYKPTDSKPRDHKNKPTFYAADAIETDPHSRCLRKVVPCSLCTLTLSLTRSSCLLLSPAPLLFLAPPLPPSYHSFFHSGVINFLSSLFLSWPWRTQATAKTDKLWQEHDWLHSLLWARPTKSTQTHRPTDTQSQQKDVQAFVCRFNQSMASSAPRIRRNGR